jgi:hypothetical protein
VDIVLFGTTRPDVSKEDRSNLPKGGHR